MLVCAVRYDRNLTGHLRGVSFDMPSVSAIIRHASNYNSMVRRGEDIVAA
jgi:hypothetical protein